MHASGPTRAASGGARSVAPASRLAVGRERWEEEAQRRAYGEGEVEDGKDVICRVNLEMLLVLYALRNFLFFIFYFI